MNNQIIKHNEKFTGKWEAAANTIDSKLIIAIGITENGHFQTYTADVFELERIIKILRHTADQLDQQKHKKIQIP